MGNTEKVWRYINKFRVAKGYSPTHREIANGLGFSSPNSSAYHIGKLEKRGWVKREKGKIRSVKGSRWGV